MIEKRKNAFSGTGKSTKTLCILLTAVFFTTVSCDKLRNNQNFNNFVTNFDISKIPIPTDDYTLGSSGCSWRFNGLKQDSLYVINSDTELANFVLCTGSNTPPYIDFTQYTLLLAYGNAYYFDFTKNYRKIAKNEYKLTVEIILDTVPFRQWHTALLVPKLPTNDTVLFELIEKSCEDTVEFTVYKIFGCAWSWSYWDTLYIINFQQDELFPIFYCMDGNVPDSIDFSKHTLLYLNASCLYQIRDVNVFLLKNYCTNQYNLNVIIYETGQMMPDTWRIAIIAPKIHNNKEIILTFKKW